jgi:hypothetical protein
MARDSSHWPPGANRRAHHPGQIPWRCRAHLARGPKLKHDLLPLMSVSDTPCGRDSLAVHLRHWQSLLPRPSPCLASWRAQEEVSCASHGSRTLQLPAGRLSLCWRFQTRSVTRYRAIGSLNQVTGPIVLLDLGIDVSAPHGAPGPSLDPRGVTREGPAATFWSL